MTHKKERSGSGKLVALRGTKPHAEIKIEHEKLL